MQVLHGLVDRTGKRIYANESHQARITRTGGKLGLGRMARYSTRTTVVIKAYRKCSISNNLNGSEDCALWEEDSDKADDTACSGDDLRFWSRHLILC